MKKEEKGCTMAMTITDARRVIVSPCWSFRTVLSAAFW